MSSHALTPVATLALLHVGMAATYGSPTPSLAPPRTPAPRQAAARILAAAPRKASAPPVAAAGACVLPPAAAPVLHPRASVRSLSSQMDALVGTSMIANPPTAVGSHPLAKRLHWSDDTVYYYCTDSISLFVPLIIQCTVDRLLLHGSLISVITLITITVLWRHLS